MRRFKGLTVSLFLLFLIACNSLLSLCFAGAGTSDNSISGEVKL